MAVSSPSVPRRWTPVANLRSNPAAPWRHVDAALVGCIGAVSSLGVLMVYSATRGPGENEAFDTTYLKKQLVFMLLGVGVMVLTALIDYRHVRDWAIPLYAGVVLLLIAVVSPLGSASKGTQAWFQLGSFQLQPSEFSKLGLIVGLAAVLSQFRGEIDLRRLFTGLVIAGLPLGLIMLQPDLGTGLVLVAITLGMLLVGGSRPRHMIALILLGALGTFFVLNSNLLQDYQKQRLTSFLDQQEGLQREAYNLNQSKSAIAAGGLAGEGLFQGTQTRLNYVPEQHTDFIFTAVGEQLGLLGSGTLLALFSIIVWRVWRTAQLARDSFGSLVCAGVLSLFVFQIFQNVGMTMGIMPITGIPLPFVSYGGSSTIAEFAAMGIVLNVHMRRFS